MEGYVRSIEIADWTQKKRKGNERDAQKDRLLPEIMNVLYRLGITANYKGFYYIAMAVRLAVENPERLLFITKWLYPDVARVYNTTVSCIERNIRTVAKLAWEKNPQLIMELACHDLYRHPPASQLISIIAQRFTEDMN